MCYTLLSCMLLLFHLTRSGQGTFTIQPSTVTQIVGENAQFECQNPDAITLTWSISGIFLYQYHPPNVTTTTFMFVNTLTLPGLLQYNETAIQCKAIFNLAADDHELSRTAYLFLRHREILYTTEAQISTSSPQHYQNTDTFSTVDGERNNGSLTNRREQTNECYRKIEEAMSDYPTLIDYFSNIKFPNETGAACSLNLTFRDAPAFSKAILKCTLEYDELCTMVWSNCAQHLKHNRIYSGTATCTQMGNSTDELLFSLSTHDVLKLEVVANSTVVEISCNFASAHNGSTATGCFIVALNQNSGTLPTYRAVYKSKFNDTKISLSIDVLGIESIHAYEIEANLFPGVYAAVTERLKVKDTADKTDITPSTDDDEMVTVTTYLDKICVIRNDSINEAFLIVYHELPDIDQGYLLLSTGYKRQIDAHIDSVYCFQVIPGHYWLAVFILEENGRMKEHPAKVTLLQVKDTTQCNNELDSDIKDRKILSQPLVIGLASGIAVLVFICSIIITVVSSSLAYKYHVQLGEVRHRSSGHTNQEVQIRMERCQAYEAVYRSSQ